VTLIIARLRLRLLLDNSSYAIIPIPLVVILAAIGFYGPIVKWI
jgi:hypothetical protein